MAPVSYTHLHGVGRDDVAQHAPRRQRHGLAGFHQPHRHRPHGGAHDVGDVGGVEHHQADHQRGEFDAGPVSYTHLDVYKRQSRDTAWRQYARLLVERADVRGIDLGGAEHDRVFGSPS